MILTSLSDPFYCGNVNNIFDLCRRKTYQPFVKGIKTPIVFEQELRPQIVRIFVNNKLVKQFDNVKEPGDFEQPFPYNDS